MLLGSAVQCRSAGPGRSAGSDGCLDPGRSAGIQVDPQVAMDVSR